MLVGASHLSTLCPTPGAQGQDAEPLPPAAPQDPLSSLERELALQLQIAEAARRLSREENLGRQARRQRKHAVLQEERKLRELERRVGERRRHSGPLPLGRGESRGLGVPRDPLPQLLREPPTPSFHFLLSPCRPRAGLERIPVPGLLSAPGPGGEGLSGQSHLWSALW